MRCPQGEATGDRRQLSPAAQADSIAKSGQAQRAAMGAKIGA